MKKDQIKKISTKETYSIFRSNIPNKAERRYLNKNVKAKSKHLKQEIEHLPYSYYYVYLFY